MIITRKGLLENHSKNTSKVKIASIEFLRCLSMILIFFTHFFMDYSNVVNIEFKGYPGVLMFFMIFAYLLTKSGGGVKSLVKRIFTIYPKYEIILFVVFIAATIKPSLFRTIDCSLENYLKSVFLIPIRMENVPYASPILPIAWTLVPQMMVFLIFWIILTISKDKNKAVIETSCLILVFWIMGKIDSQNSMLTFTFGRFYMLYFIAGFIASYIEDR